MSTLYFREFKSLGSVLRASGKGYALFGRNATPRDWFVFLAGVVVGVVPCVVAGALAEPVYSAARAYPAVSVAIVLAVDGFLLLAWARSRQREIFLRTRRAEDEAERRVLAPWTDQEVPRCVFLEPSYYDAWATVGATQEQWSLHYRAQILSVLPFEAELTLKSFAVDLESGGAVGSWPQGGQFVIGPGVGAVLPFDVTLGKEVAQKLRSAAGAAPAIKAYVTLTGVLEWGTSSAEYYSRVPTYFRVQ